MNGKLSVAAENDNFNVTISGDVEAMDEFEKFIADANKSTFIRRLDTRKAFHSHHMDDIEDMFTKKLGKVSDKPKGGNIKFFSSTEGREVSGSEMQNEFWWKNLRNPVLFNSSTKSMLKDGIRTFIEISPRPVLSYYIHEIAKQYSTKDVTVIQVKQCSFL